MPGTNLCILCKVRMKARLCAQQRLSEPRAQESRGGGSAAGPILPSKAAARLISPAMASKSNPRPASRAQKALPEIPDKLYYRIGEVARLCGVETYVLRFWETEFPQLKPNKSGAGQRLYRRREVELARRIRDLLYRDGYTIPGARQAIFEAGRANEPRDSGGIGTSNGNGSTAHAAASHSASAEEESAHLPLVRAGLETGPESPRLGRLRLELKEILGLLSGASASPGGRAEESSIAVSKQDAEELFK